MSMFSPLQKQVSTPFPCSKHQCKTLFLYQRSPLERRKRSPRIAHITSSDDLHAITHNDTSDFRKNPTLYSKSTTATDTTTATRNRKKPEVLAPAGGWPQLCAAIENGADAVYFGTTTLNARARASNFPPEELPSVMSYLHERGAKGYLVINVLCFDTELIHLARLAQQAYSAHVDAVIVQDLGAVEIIRRAAPHLPIHASTQMTITSAEGAAFAASRGIERVVVGRELSLKDIASVSSGSSSADVEAFVHGALCVSYSGQCFSSEAWGGRSANRGQCAQACRKEYGLLVDGTLQYMGDVQYLLSPQDLAAVELVPQLIDAGVVCFKIEGRLKGPEYVALTTKTYRDAVDKAWQARLSGILPQKQPLSDAEWRDLQQVFARGQDGVHRGLTPGFLEGPQHQSLVRGRAPRHRGTFLGEILEITDRGSIVVSSLRAPLQRGDGVVVDAGDAGKEEYGGTVVDIKRIRSVGGRARSMLDYKNSNNSNTNSRATTMQHGGARNGKSNAEQDLEEEEEAAAVEITLYHGSGANGRKQQQHDNTTNTKKSSQRHPRRHVPSMYLWKNKDPSLESSIRSTYENLSSLQRRRRPASVKVYLEEGRPLCVEVWDEQGRLGMGRSMSVVERALTKPLTRKEVEKAIGKNLGDEGSLMMSSLEVVPASGASRPGVDDQSSSNASAATIRRKGEAQLQEVSTYNQSDAWDVFIAASEIKEARRHAVNQLIEQQVSVPMDVTMLPSPEHVVDEMLASILQRTSAIVPPSTQHDYPAADDTDDGMGTKQTEMVPRPGRSNNITLRVLCRTKAHVDAAIAIPDIEIILDFLEVHGLKEACQDVRHARKRVIVAMPRIIKPDEHRLWIFYLKLGADALLVRGAGVLHQFMELGGPGTLVNVADNMAIPRLEGDFSLNASNVISTHALLSAGLDTLAPTHDCNAVQLADIARNLGASNAARLEGIIHTNLPVFHTEACLFARFLSDGNSFLDCGHPCEHHTVHLHEETSSSFHGHEDAQQRDGKNMHKKFTFKNPVNTGWSSQDHLVLADMGCRNTVFTASAQSALPFINELVRAGYRMFRIELVDQPADVVPRLVEGYRKAIQDALVEHMGDHGSSHHHGRKRLNTRNFITPAGSQALTGSSSSHLNNNSNSSSSNIDAKHDAQLLHRKKFWTWMQRELRDANGRAHGVGIGSLEVREERKIESMKPTAASLRYGDDGAAVVAKR